LLPPVGRQENDNRTSASALADPCRANDGVIISRRQQRTSRMDTQLADLAAKIAHRECGAQPLVAVESNTFSQPTLLASLLRPGLSVAEMPGDAWHLPGVYATAQAEVVLVHDYRSILQAARRQAGYHDVKPILLSAPVQKLVEWLSQCDLTVIPHGAFYRLAPGASSVETLTALAWLLKPGSLLLAQVLGPAIQTTCELCAPVRSANRLVTIQHLLEDLTAAGWVTITIQPGPSGFIEVLAARSAT
jgi:hypothetical protein